MIRAAFGDSMISMLKGFIGYQFKIKYRVIMFSRDAWFSEFIAISDTSDLDSVYPICKAKDSWRNDDESEVIIHKTTKSLRNDVC